MVANMQVNDKDLRDLANARAAAVRQWLGQKVEPARVLVSAPKLDATGIADKGKTTRAELLLE